MSENDNKSSLIDWGSIEDQNTEHREVNWLRLKSPGVYNVRLVHKPIPVHRYYNRRNRKSAICADPKNCPIVIKGYMDEENKPMKPKTRYAIHVIDRADGQLKVMEGPRAVFIAFKEFYENNGVDPGGKDSCDFCITVTGAGLQTDYKVSYKLMNRKPFTQEEKAMIDEQHYDLSALFRPTPADQIEAKLGLVDGRTESEAPVEETPVEQEQPAKPVQKTAAPQQQASKPAKKGFDWADE